MGDKDLVTGKTMTVSAWIKTSGTIDELTQSWGKIIILIHGLSREILPPTKLGFLLVQVVIAIRLFPTEL